MKRRNFFQTVIGGAAAVFGANRLNAASLQVTDAYASQPTLGHFDKYDPNIITQNLRANLVGAGEELESTAPFWKGKEKQANMLGQLLSTPQGRQKLATSLGPALSRRRDYMSLARKAFCVVDGDEVKSLTAPYLHYVDPSVKPAFSSIGGFPSLSIPTFKIAFNQRFSIPQIIEPRRYDLVARGLNIGKSEVVAAENKHMFDLIDSVAWDDIQFDTSFIATTRDRFSKNGVEEVRYIFANPSDATEIIKLAAIGGDTIRYEPNLNTKLLKTGLFGHVDGVSLYQSRSVNKGFMYITGGSPATQAVDGVDDAIHAGYVVEKVGLSVMSGDYPPKQIGFNISEEVGFAVNPDAVVRISMKG